MDRNKANLIWLASVLLLFFFSFRFAGFFTQRPADEPPDDDFLAQLDNLLINQVLNGFTAVPDISLVEQNGFFFIFLNETFNDL